MKISGRAQRIEPFHVMEIAKAASALGRELEHTASPMIFLNIGEPDFTAPPLVQEAAARAIRDAGRRLSGQPGRPWTRDLTKRFPPNCLRMGTWLLIHAAIRECIGYLQLVRRLATD